MALLSKLDIEKALTYLGELALAEGHHIELLVVGGAAMVLLYNARPATHDVDVMILSPRQAKIVRDLAQQVATDYDWPLDWLNDGAKAYLQGLSQGAVLLSSPGIVVKSPATAQLLAMKLSAWRDDVDIADAQQLLANLSGTKTEIWQKVETFLYPGIELKAQYAFMDLWEAIYGEN